MAERKSFLIRLDPDLLDSLRRWADADLRSVNGQIEFLLRRAVADSGGRAGAFQEASAPEPDRESRELGEDK